MNTEQVNAFMAQLASLTKALADKEERSDMRSTSSFNPRITTSVPKFGDDRGAFMKFLRKLRSILAAKSRKALAILEGVLASKDKQTVVLTAGDKGKKPSAAETRVKVEGGGEEKRDGNLKLKQDTSSMMYALIMEGCSHDDNMARLIDVEWKVLPGDGLLAMWHLKRHFMKTDQALVLDLEEKLLQMRQGNATLTTYLLDVQDLMNRCESASGEEMKNIVRVRHVLRGLDKRYRDKKEHIMEDISNDRLEQIKFEKVLERLHDFKRIRGISDRDETGGGAAKQKRALALEVLENLPFSRKEKKKNGYRRQGDNGQKKAFSGQCFNCKRQGHREVDCRQPCKTCKAKNHTRYNCPERKKSGGKASGGGGGGGADVLSELSLCVKKFVAAKDGAAARDLVRTAFKASNSLKIKGEKTYDDMILAAVEAGEQYRLDEARLSARPAQAAVKPEKRKMHPKVQQFLLKMGRKRGMCRDGSKSKASKNSEPVEGPGLDSCASDHFVGRDLLNSLRRLRAPPKGAHVLTADSTKHTVVAVGDTPTLKDVKIVPTLQRQRSLISLGKLEKEGRHVIITDGKVYMKSARQRLDTSSFQHVGSRTAGDTYTIDVKIASGEEPLVAPGTPFAEDAVVLEILQEATPDEAPRAGGHLLMVANEITASVLLSRRSSERDALLLAQPHYAEAISSDGREAGVTPALLQLYVNAHDALGHRPGEWLAWAVSQGDIFLDSRLTAAVIRACAREHVCVPCQLAKLKKQPIRKTEGPRRRTAQPGELLMMDLVGPISPASSAGHRHGSVIVDSFSGAVFAEPICRKPDAAEHLDNVLTEIFTPLFKMSKSTEPRILGLRTDNAPELVNEPTASVIRRHNIVLKQRTGVESSYQNGLAEVEIRLLTERVRTAMVRGRAPPEYWHYAMRDAAFLQRRLPTKTDPADSRAPLQKLLRTHLPLDLTWLRPFWSPVFIVRLQRERVKSRRFQAIGDIGRLLGHVPGRKAYLLLRLRDSKVVIRSPRFVFFLRGKAGEFRVGDELHDAALVKAREGDSFQPRAESGDGVEVSFSLRDEFGTQVVVADQALPDGFPRLGIEDNDADEDMLLEDVIDDGMGNAHGPNEDDGIYVAGLGRVQAAAVPGGALHITPAEVSRRSSGRTRKQRVLHNVGPEAKWQRVPHAIREQKKRPRLASAAGGRDRWAGVRHARFAGVDDDAEADHSRFEGVENEEKANGEGEVAPDGAATDAKEGKSHEVPPVDDEEAEELDEVESDQESASSQNGNDAVAPAEVDEILVTRYLAAQGRDDFCVQCLVKGGACGGHRQSVGKQRVEELMTLAFCTADETRRRQGDAVGDTTMVTEYGMTWPRDLPAAPPNKRLEDVFVPRTLQQALASEDRHYWARAMASEFKQMDDHEVWVAEPHPKTGEKILTPMVAFTPQDKDGKGFVTKYKARLCCRGFQQVEGLHFDDVFAPTIRHASVRLELAIIVAERLAGRQFDFKAAYLNAPVDKVLLMRAPAGYPIQSGMVLRLLKALYGLRQAGKCWNDAVTQGLKSLGFTQCKYDPCVFVRGKPGDANRAIIGLHVDDGKLGAATEKAADELIKELGKLFPMGHSGSLGYFLGLKVQHSRERSLATISATTFIESLLRKFGLEDCNPAPNPCVSGQSALPKAAENEAYADGSREHRAFQVLVGCGTWLTITCRPDIAFAVGRLQAHMARPCDRHFQAGKRLLRYLKGTKHLGLVFVGDAAKNNPLLWAHSDSDFAGDVDTRRSTSGMAVFVLGSLVDWRSKRIKGVDVSVGSAEYKTASEAARTLLYTRHLMHELGIMVTPELGVDNQGVIQAAGKLCYSGRMKHLEIQHHFIREVVAEKKVLLQKVASQDNRADIMTKALTNDEFQRQRSFLVKDVRTVWPKGAHG